MCTIIFYFAWLSRNSFCHRNQVANKIFKLHNFNIYLFISKIFSLNINFKFYKDLIQTYPLCTTHIKSGLWKILAWLIHCWNAILVIPWTWWRWKSTLSLLQNSKVFCSAFPALSLKTMNLYLLNEVCEWNKVLKRIPVDH